MKALKSLGLPSKINTDSQVSLKDGETISFDEKTYNNFFKNFYTNLALNLVNKLAHAPNKFDLHSVLAYYKRFLNTENQKFTFSPTSEDEILKLLTDTNSNHYTRKVQKQIQKTIVPFHYCHLSLKL